MCYELFTVIGGPKKSARGPLVVSHCVTVSEHVRSEVLTALSMKMRVCDIAPCSLGGVDRRFRRAYCVDHQGDGWQLPKI
jgi:hypothetical protein